MATILNEGKIKQGDTEWISFELENRSSLDDRHPLKTNGLRTPGYIVRFMVKISFSVGDAQAIISKVMTPESDDIAVVELTPDDTKALTTIVPEAGLTLFYEVQASFPSSDPALKKIFTIDGANGTKSFTLVKELIITEEL